MLHCLHFATSLGGRCSVVRHAYVDHRRLGVSGCPGSHRSRCETGDIVWHRFGMPHGICDRDVTEGGATTVSRHNSSQYGTSARECIGPSSPQLHCGRPSLSSTRPAPSLSSSQVLVMRKPTAFAFLELIEAGFIAFMFTVLLSSTPPSPRVRHSVSVQFDLSQPFSQCSRPPCLSAAGLRPSAGSSAVRTEARPASSGPEVKPTSNVKPTSTAPTQVSISGNNRAAHHPTHSWSLFRRCFVHARFETDGTGSRLGEAAFS